MSRTAVIRALALATCVIGIGSLAACGDDSPTTAPTAAPTTGPTTTEPAEKVEAVRYETIGGCQMMGPNCGTWVVYADGTVEIYRTGENEPAEITGSIPAAEIAAYLESVKGTDFQALAEEVGPGTCQACLDGVDITLTLGLDSGPVVLESTVVNFDLEHPFFVNLETLMNDVWAVGELPIEQR